MSGSKGRMIRYSVLAVTVLYLLYLWRADPGAVRVPPASQSVNNAAQRQLDKEPQVLNLDSMQQLGDGEQRRIEMREKRMQEQRKMEQQRMQKQRESPAARALVDEQNRIARRFMENRKKRAAQRAQKAVLSDADAEQLRIAQRFQKNLLAKQKAAREKRKLAASSRSRPQGQAGGRRSARKEYPRSPGTYRTNDPEVGRKQTILIPTECLDGYQEWQQVVAVNSLKRLQLDYPDSQTFDIVRLVACDDPEKKMVQHNKDLSEYHISRVFSTTENGIFAPTLNKPGALMDWLLNGPGKHLDDDHELVVVDVDFFFKAPIPYQGSQPGVIRAGKFHMGREFFDKPVMQQFCRGACDKWTPEWLSNNGIGPPYVMRKREALRLFSLWYEITLAMVEAGSTTKPWEWPGHWFADMYAIMFALELSDGVTVEYDFDSWIVTADYGLWMHFTDVTKVYAFHFFSKYDIAANKLPGMSLDETSKYAAKFNKHDWRANGVKVMLQCDRETQMSIWKKYGWNVPPALFEPEPPSQGLVPGTPPVSPADVNGQRNLYVWWHLFHGVNDALAMWRQDNCP